MGPSTNRRAELPRTSEASEARTMARSACRTRARASESDVVRGGAATTGDSTSGSEAGGEGAGGLGAQASGWSVRLPSIARERSYGGDELLEHGGRLAYVSTTKEIHVHQQVVELIDLSTNSLVTRLKGPEIRVLSVEFAVEAPK